MTEVKSKRKKPAKVDEAVEKAVEKNISPFKSRFQDATWFGYLHRRDVMLLGCGGIGSWVALGLSRIGCSIYVFDMDIIEAHNLGGQAFASAMVGKSKTAAIVELCRSLSGNDTIIHPNGMYTEESPTSDVVILAFDNMKARKIAFEKWAAYVQQLTPERAKHCILIDGRLLAEDYQVYAVTPSKIEDYRKTLFDDSEVEEVLCTLKSTTHCSMGIASEIISVLTNFAANAALDQDMREVPFSISKSIQSYSYNLSDSFT